MKCGPYGGVFALSVVAVCTSMRRCTVLVVVVKLLFGFESFGVVTRTVFVITVPSGVAGSTLTVSVNTGLSAPLLVTFVVVHVSAAPTVAVAEAAPELKPTDGADV